MAKLISLEGATVVVPSGWTAPAGGDQLWFGYDDGCYCEEVGATVVGIALGYNIDFMGPPTLVAKANYIAFNNGSGWGVGPVYNSSKLTFRNFGTYCATNQQFIQWLLDNNAEITGGKYEAVVELKPFLTNIANAIRTKKGTTVQINAQNFASEIDSIESGGGEQKSFKISCSEESNLNYTRLKFSTAPTSNRDNDLHTYTTMSYGMPYVSISCSTNRGFETNKVMYVWVEDNSLSSFVLINDVRYELSTNNTYDNPLKIELNEYPYSIVLVGTYSDGGSGGE